MAKIFTTQLIDDIEGKVLSDGQTVRWGLDGREYELDTSPKNAEAFRKTFARYVDASRKSGRTPARALPQPAKNVRSKEQTSKIRDWANTHGYEVSSRGRIPATIVEAFNAAH